VLLHLVVDQVRVVHVRAKRNGPFGVECREGVLTLAQEFAHRLRVIEAVDLALLVTGQEAVVGNDDGQANVHVFADSDRREIHVVNRLGIPCHQDDPAGIQHKVDVGVITTDIEWPRYRACRYIQHHGNTGAGLHGQLFQ